MKKIIIFFFFSSRRRHTRFDCDWSSDVCSSDLSHPTGRVWPEALKQLEIAKLPTEGLRSKDWSEFALPDAPKMDFVFTVCDNAANEACPVWPGQPITAHWGVADPAQVVGSPEQIEKAFRDAFLILDRRINLLLCLPLASLDQLAIRKEVKRIGSQ